MRHSTRNLQHTVPEGKHKRPSCKRRPAVEGLEERALLSTAHDLAIHKHVAVPDNTANDFKVTPLVTNIPYQLQGIYDPSLVNPWDINFQQDKHNDPFVWVSDQAMGVATMYNISSDGSTVEKSPVTVTIPGGGSMFTGPTGVVYNSTYNSKTNKLFKIPGPNGKSVPAEYIFDTLQGTVGGYNPGHNGNNSLAQIMVKDNNPSTTEYTGLAAGTFNGKHYIYAANNSPGGGIDVYTDSFQPHTFHGKDRFFDPDLPAGAGFTPYGVHDLGAPNNKELYVTYRSPDGVGGAVAHFTNNGTFVGQIACDTTTSGYLQSPYGMDQAPKSFGSFSNDILVGNFSTGEIDAYNFGGTFQGQLDIENIYGTPIPILGLMAIHFGSGLGAHEPKIALLFTAAPFNGLVGEYGMIRPTT